LVTVEILFTSRKTRRRLRRVSPCNRLRNSARAVRCWHENACAIVSIGNGIILRAKEKTLQRKPALQPPPATKSSSRSSKDVSVPPKFVKDSPNLQSEWNTPRLAVAPTTSMAMWRQANRTALVLFEPKTAGPSSPGQYLFARQRRQIGGLVDLGRYVREVLLISFTPRLSRRRRRSRSVPPFHVPDLRGNLFHTCFAGLQQMHSAFNAQTLEIRHRRFPKDALQPPGKRPFACAYGSRSTVEGKSTCELGTRPTFKELYTGSECIR